MFLKNYDYLILFVYLQRFLKIQIPLLDFIMEKEETKNTANNNTSTNQETPKVEVLIVRHKQLFETLKNPRMMWRVLLSLFFIIVVLFAGLVFVILSIKSFYPYNAIQTNLYGATIMKTEDKEVIYWLFNTAELWANSGIEVHKNDELTIRASGASFTAIHHLVEHAQKNSLPSDKWVDTDGQNKTDPRDVLRAKYRISNQCEEGKLLMQVIPAEYQKTKISWDKETLSHFDNKQNIEVIGKGREKLKIKQDGILHFTVNDIVLDKNTIEKMYKENLDSILKVSHTPQTDKNIINDSINYFFQSDQPSEGLLERLNKTYFATDSTDYSQIGLRLGEYPDKKNKYPFVNELIYYKEKQYFDAWFMDNVGSFLIVIERKK